MLKLDYRYTHAWNLFLITAGAVLFSLGVKAIAVHHNFITGGLFGTSLLIYYTTGIFSPGVWYFLLNIPLFIVSWFLISKRFFYYSLYAMVVITVSYELMDLNFGVDEQLYAAISAGIICGAGGGIVLRSLGSCGGLDVIAVILFQKFNLGIGKFYFLFNSVLFSFSLLSIDVDLVIASLILVFIMSYITEYILSMFSQRKMVMIVSEKIESISARILKDLHIGATYLKGKGAYSGKDKDILLTVINNIQLKRLEEVVFTEDPNALFIVENTFNVLGSSFSKRKLY